MRSKIVQAELQLLDPLVRLDAQRLGELLDESFSEIGQSGRLWTRAEMILELTQSEEAAEFEAPPAMSEVHFMQLVDGIYLLTYRLDVGTNRSRRSSIWSANDSETRMLFHQGTPSQ